MDSTAHLALFTISAYAVSAYISLKPRMGYSTPPGHSARPSVLRMLQAGVIISDYTTLMVEILKDNARPEAGEVYGAMDMAWAKLMGQISRAYGKQTTGGKERRAISPLLVRRRARRGQRVPSGRRVHVVCPLSNRDDGDGSP